MAHAAGFLLLAAIMICTPGPDTALTVRNTLVGGRPNGVRTAAGIASGLAVWTLAASVGVAALVAAWQPLFDAVRLAGAVYLAWLGVHALLAAIRGRGPDGRRSRGAGGYRQGLLSNLGNPKVAVFFTSLLPQFASSFGGLVALGLAFCGLTAVWMTAYAFAVARARRALLRPRIQRALDAVTGLTLVAFGARLATE
jgi:threonine/homoserine/homoserine lactone efflux protein